MLNRSISKTMIGACGLLLAAVLMSGCEEEGPAEKAGKKLDNAAEQTGEAMKDLGEKAKDATK